MRNTFECCSDLISPRPGSRRTVQALFVITMFFLALLPAALSVIPSLPSSDNPEEPMQASTMAAPTLSITHPAIIYVALGVPFTVYLNVTDVDNDNVNITWEWGDGTANDTYMTGPAASRTMVPMVHTWDPYVEPGTGGFSINFTLRVTINDGTGNTVSQTRNVVVNVPSNIGPTLGVSAPTLVDPEDEVTIVANGSDPEGESLTWTFVFNDSVSNFLTIVNVTPVTAPGEVVWNNVTHIFGAPGNYTVNVSISDAIGVNQSDVSHNNTQTLMIQAKANQLPYATNLTITPTNRQIRDEVGYLVVNYSLEVLDLDGDVLNATWDFGDGSAPAYNESAGTAEVYVFRQQMNYTNPGTFNISVVITDGRAGHELLRYTILAITSTNMPPSIVIFEANYSGRSAALPNQTVNFTLTITDPELNTVEVVIDFGDNSTRLYFNLTGYENFNVTVIFSHVYSEVGNYTVQIWYTDNRIGIFEHNKEYNLTVVVYVPPPPIIFHYTLWDYTSMGLFAMIPVLIVVGFVWSRRKHKQIEDKGMTVDEWKIFQKVMEEEEEKLK